jgi:hypothetical protein
MPIMKWPWPLDGVFSANHRNSYENSYRNLQLVSLSWRRELHPAAQGQLLLVFPSSF